MKVELHLHTMRYSACSAATPFDEMERLIDAGYGAVYITEHDAVWEDYELEHLRGEFPAIRIFPGVELSLESSHLLVLGTNDPRYLAAKDPAAILQMARGEGHLTVLAHPFRWENADRILHGKPLPDAIEGRTGNHDAKGAAQSIRVGQELRLPTVNAGDIHALSMIDQFWIETQGDVTAADDIRTIVLAGAYRNCGKVT